MQSIRRGGSFFVQGLAGIFIRTYLLFVQLRFRYPLFILRCLVIGIFAKGNYPYAAQRGMYLITITCNKKAEQITRQ
jgi:hypothetical protein